MKKAHLAWSNRKPMRTLGGKSPLELLKKSCSLTALAKVARRTHLTMRPSHNLLSSTSGIFFPYMGHIYLHHGTFLCFISSSA